MALSILWPELSSRRTRQRATSMPEAWRKHHEPAGEDWLSLRGVDACVLRRADQPGDPHLRHAGSNRGSDRHHAGRSRPNCDRAYRRRSDMATNQAGVVWRQNRRWIPRLEAAFVGHRGASKDVTQLVYKLLKRQRGTSRRATIRGVRGGGEKAFGARIAPPQRRLVALAG